MHEGIKRRFHVQRNDAGDFYITNKDHCPAEYHKAEELLNKAIKIYGGPGSTAAVAKNDAGADWHRFAAKEPALQKIIAYDIFEQFPSIFEQ